MNVYTATALVLVLTAGLADASGARAPVRPSGSAAVTAPDQASIVGPCDIMASAGQTCVAAHGVTRRLFGAYKGPLFQLTRSSDGMTQDIGSISTGLYDAAAVADFCTGTACAFSEIYDQSGNGNNLPQTNRSLQAPWLIHPQKALPVVWTSQVLGYYRNRTSTTKIPTGTQAATEYYVRATDVISGVGDYGRMEDPLAACGGPPSNCPDGAMWALAYSNYQRWGAAAGVRIAGLGVDNEFYETTVNLASIPEFVTVLSKYNSSTNTFTNKYADVTSLRMTELAQGAPSTTPIVQNGLSLGEGGDGSLGGSEFFEGVVASGATSDATDNLVQANVSAFYGGFTAPVQGPDDVLMQKGTVKARTGLDASVGFGGAWGLRRLRASYTGYAAIVARASDGTSINVGFTPSGDFDDQTAQAFCAGTTCSAQLMNQSLSYHGNTPDSSIYDMLNPTSAKQPSLAFNNLNGKTTLHFSGSQYLCTRQGIKRLAPAWAIAAVGRRSGNTAAFGVLAGSNNTAGGALGFAASVNTVQFEPTSGESLTGPLEDGKWGSLIGLDNNGGGALYINGAKPITGTGPSSGMDQYVCLGSGNDISPAGYLAGDLAEVIVIGTTITPAQAAALYQNQRVYYGGVF